jgi:hypothetical protein
LLKVAAEAIPWPACHEIFTLGPVRERNLPEQGAIRHAPDIPHRHDATAEVVRPERAAGGMSFAHSLLGEEPALRGSLT